MKAIQMTPNHPVDHPESLLDTDLPAPTPAARELLVRVHAVSVNPVDAKVRQGAISVASPILGWDAAGIVEAVGSEVTLFKAGDAVYYAGSLRQPGTNSELHTVDERIVGHMPKTLDFADAAALPLTALTAYEALFDRLRIDKDGADRGKSILVIGGAGGVGSMTIQMAKLASLRVIATASRPETRAWCTTLGATDIVNHRKDLVEEVRALGLSFVDYIVNFADTRGHWDAMVELIRPQGDICSIVESKEPLALTQLMTKSARFSWELMFTRPIFETEDMVRQHEILNEVAAWIDEQKIVGTAKERHTPINAENLRKAHARLESGKAVGKIVLSGW